MTVYGIRSPNHVVGKFLLHGLCYKYIQTKAYDITNYSR